MMSSCDRLGALDHEFSLRLGRRSPVHPAWTSHFEFRGPRHGDDEGAENLGLRENPAKGFHGVVLRRMQKRSNGLARKLSQRPTSWTSPITGRTLVGVLIAASHIVTLLLQLVAAVRRRNHEIQLPYIIISHLAASPRTLVRSGTAAPAPASRLFRTSRGCLFGCKDLLAKSDSRLKCRLLGQRLTERAGPLRLKPLQPGSAMSSRSPSPQRSCTMRRERKL